MNRRRDGIVSFDPGIMDFKIMSNAAIRRFHFGTNGPATPNIIRASTCDAATNGRQRFYQVLHKSNKLSAS